MKAAKRDKRAGGADAAAAKAKSCDMCDAPSHLLVRCQTDTTGAWRMVCGKCWKKASGGVPDGDASAKERGYRYGGLWRSPARRKGDA